MNQARQVPPPSESQLKKRKGPDPPPPADGDTSTKRTKISEPGGLVPNWKKSVGLLSHIAKKHPIEFVDDEDVVEEGEFDRAEGPETLNAVRASKPSTVRIDSKSVSHYHMYLGPDSQTAQLDRHENHPAPHQHSSLGHAAQT